MVNDEVTDLVLLDVRDDGVAVLTLNRPERRNAWTPALEHQYFALLDELDVDDRVRAIVLTGSGETFCPGVDSERLENLAGGALSMAGRRSPLRVWELRKPIVAAINGGCAGVGLVQALLCDVRFVATEAKLATAFSRRGLAGEYGVTWLLPRMIGLPRATELLLSGRAIDADEAFTLGLAHRVVPRSELLGAAIAYAAELAARCAPTSMALLRHQLRVDLESDLGPALERSYRAMAFTVADVDIAEGVASLVEKRDATFRTLPADYSPSAIVGAELDALAVNPEEQLP